MAAEARQRYLSQKAATAAARLEAAERAYQEGDIKVASMLYIRTALSRPKNAATDQAKQRLTQLAEEARQKLKAIDEKLAGSESLLSPSEALAPGGPPSPEKLAARLADRVAAAFDEYKELSRTYDKVPKAGSEIKTHIAKQRRQPHFAAVLNEPEAKALVQLAQQHEQEDSPCCAYWVYQQAAKLAPAPSALQAAARFDQMQQDPRIVAAAERCRKLQECHKLYKRAEMLFKAKPVRALELFGEIVDRAPQDSEVYRAAHEQIAGIR